MTKRWLGLVVAGWLLCASVAQAALPVALGTGEKLPSLAPMLKTVRPAVVNIATYATVEYVNPLLADPFFRRFFDLPPMAQQREKRPQSAGSGVIIDAEKGYVITNHHVIENADSIEVLLTDGRKFGAHLLGSDEQVDLALLQIEARDLTALPMADSRQLEVGDFVVAVGNPFGLGQTVTSGIVSALGRSGLGLNGYEDYIQTDASINPGNSGGALVNLRGELVGINSAILAPAGGNVGIGFAIPTEIVRVVADQLARYGEVRRGGIGVEFQDLTPELADAFGLPSTSGALIARVVPGAPAERAGLRSGDVVVQANGHPVSNADDLRKRIGLTPIGQTLTLSVVRDGRTRNVSVTVEDPVWLRQPGGAMHPDLDGALFQDVYENGESVAVEIVEVQKGSPAWEAGLRAGDVILAVNRTRVRSTAEMKSRIRRSRSAVLQLQRDGRLYVLRLE